MGLRKGTSNGTNMLGGHLLFMSRMGPRSVTYNSTIIMSACRISRGIYYWITPVGQRAMSTAT